MAIGLNTVEEFGLGNASYKPTLLKLEFKPQVLNLSICLIIFQIIDGIFTSMGVSRYGTSIEGNPFLRGLIEDYGQLPVLSGIKFIAILFVIVLAMNSRHIPWIASALRAICYVYFFSAIVPWAYILFVAV